ncbi:MAG: protein-L-isoaspartate(D-aspartate) O-methyltransferase [Planctomycetes bacterium]|nr:protein-L-isoaspartate(D-aspartate) O-methyltransferase [Planctomycetota bacterium]
MLGCNGGAKQEGAAAPGPPSAAPETTFDPWEAKRMGMVDEIRAYGVRDPLVLEAMREVPRHEFIPDEPGSLFGSSPRAQAYEDHPVSIGYGQTISQPYIVAFMSEALRLKGGEKVLEVGTGSGYQAAVLAAMGVEVYTIEIVPQLAERAKATLERLGCEKVHVRAGDGYRGWPEEAPFDAVIVTAAPPHIPQPLIDQLEVGGRMIIPVGGSSWDQDLRLIVRTSEGISDEAVLPVRFVPMTGEAQKH